MTSAGVSAPHSEIDANCNAATQPSVELRRSVTSALARSNPATSTRNDRASVTSKHIAPTSISTSSSRTRMRLSGRPGPRPARHDDLQIVGAVLEQERHRTSYGGGGDAVPVVDEDRHRLVTLVDLVDQRRQHVLFGVLPMLFEDLTEIGGHGRICSPDRFHQVRQKPHQVVVVVVDGQPRDLHPIARQFLRPLRGQCRLSVSGRRVNHDQSPPISRA